MRFERAIALVLGTGTLLVAPRVASAGQLAVLSVDPPRHALNAPISSSITIHFDQPVLPASIDASTFRAFGRWSGTVGGVYIFSKGDRAVTLDPARPFSAGEQVMVVLSHDIRAADGTTLRNAGYSYQFWTSVLPTDMTFEQIDVLSTNSGPGESSRPYGGIASDLNGDAWLDITIVNEDTADLRVFLNRADGTGLFDDFLQPTFPVNDRASPSEPADFNHDGVVDICVANINTNSVSILLGNGDGTFAPQQQITVGLAPRGIAVLDTDGDGDIDIVNTNSSIGNMSILFNDGSGVFGAPTFFDGGGLGEWALAAADMNDDGVLDLVIGANSSQTIIVNLANGDGTFSPAAPQSAGGAVWMLVCGDVDGNGTEDVAAVNSSHNSGAILLGHGDGTLSPPIITPTDSFPLATDLGDLDGDGDLDWVTSSFGGDWRLFTNNGDGTFVFAQEFPAPIAASCALLFDIDNDHDLDLGLIDELADVVVVLTNGGTAPGIPGDLDGDGSVDVSDLMILFENWGPCPDPPDPCPADLNGDGTVGILDLLILLTNWGPCAPPPDPCPADLDGDGSVGILDLLMLLANWG